MAVEKSNIVAWSALPQFMEPLVLNAIILTSRKDNSIIFHLMMANQEMK